MDHSGFSFSLTGFPRQAKLFELNFIRKTFQAGQIRRAKPSSQLVNLPGAQPLMKPLRIKVH